MYFSSTTRGCSPFTGIVSLITRIASQPPRYAIFVGVGRVRLVDVEVFVVVAEDRQAPRAVFVVADRDAGQHGLAAADHVPARARRGAPSSAATAPRSCDADRWPGSDTCSASESRRRPSCSIRCRADRRFSSRAIAGTGGAAAAGVVGRAILGAHVLGSERDGRARRRIQLQHVGREGSSDRSPGPA